MVLLLTALSDRASARRARHEEQGKGVRDTAYCTGLSFEIESQHLITIHRWNMCLSALDWTRIVKATVVSDTAVSLTTSANYYGAQLYASEI